MKRFSNLLGAAPLVAWYGWGLSHEVPAFLMRYHTLFAGMDGLFALETAAQAIGILFTAFLILLLIVRDVPQASSRGFVSVAAAFVGTFLAVSFYVLPIVTLPVPLLVVSALLSIVGLGGALYTLIYLGRSFAILPSARRLVTDGPYRFVRHPLYLFEEITVIGIMIQFAQPWSLIVMVAHFAAQLTRMRYEERTLTEAFPAYAGYAAKIWRLIPGVY